MSGGCARAIPRLARDQNQSLTPWAYLAYSPNSSQAKALAECLNDTKVWILRDQPRRACFCPREIDVCLINYD